MKNILAMFVLSLSLGAQASSSYLSSEFQIYNVKGEIYQSGDQVKKAYDENLQKRFGNVSSLELSEALISATDLQAQLEILRSTLKNNEEVIVRVKRDEAQVIEVRMEDLKNHIDYVRSPVGLTLNTLGRIMYLGAPQRASEVVADAQANLNDLENNLVHDLYIFTDYKLKAQLDAKNRPVFSYLSKKHSMESLAQRMSESHYYYGGVANILKASENVDTQIIEIFSVQK